MDTVPISGIVKSRRSWTLIHTLTGINNNENTDTIDGIERPKTMSVRTYMTANRNARRRSDAGVTLIATLVILIVYAGFASLLQAKAMARSNLAIELTDRYETTLAKNGARAVLLPEVAEALLLEREGLAGPFDLTGAGNAFNYAGREWAFTLIPAVQNHTWIFKLSVGEILGSQSRR